ncbi:AAA family ATPase [Azospirillum sp. B2RO_4]|uniref:AAA family ATPase n=1 Tax=Azospirillum sp. B2RO_4 TaxID=3027796 RepID=UPI003DAA125A
MSHEASHNFVETAAIKAAVLHHEQAVLAALRINWQAGRGPHIDCPYPDHGGKNDFRWDDQQAKAFCSCRNAHDIFDVVRGMTGADFAAAKLFVAETIGRSDLIRGKSDRQGTHRRVEDLLAPPDGNRDDSLPLTYLAHRLRVPACDVLMPSTRFAGHKALGYYDPPPVGSAKPVLVAQPPCAVYETVAADGRVHAMRIYLAEDGYGKADLGGRDPKKSVRVPEGSTSTSGCGVVWGDAKVAEHVYVCEGIETGAAIAYAMTPAIGIGHVAVVAAISAGGMEAFRPWPATKLVTVAADRDEGAALGKQPSRRGEMAARKLGLSLRDRVPVSIALPGGAGEKVDWLDIHVRDGADAVQRGLDAAVPFVPTAEEAGKAPSSNQEGARNTKLTRLRFSELHARIDTDDFVQGLLTTTALSVFYGDSNAGKTFVVLDLALHIALGWPWHGRRVERGGVVYVAAEGGSGVLNRIEAFKRHHDLAPNLEVPFSLVPSPVNLLDPEADVEELIALIQGEAAGLGEPVKLVVIDTLSRALAGGNENASEDMGALVMNVDRIRKETGAHLLLIHHCGKDAAKGARGHSLLRAATDTEVEIARSESAKGGAITVTKQRDLPIPAPFGYGLKTIELGVNRHGETVTSCAVEPCEHQGAAGRRKKKSDIMLHLQALKNVIAAKGIVVSSRDVASVPSVSTADFHEMLKSQSLVGAEKKDTENQQVRRIIYGLCQENWAATGGRRIWLCNPEELSA